MDPYHVGRNERQRPDLDTSLLARQPEMQATARLCLLAACGNPESLPVMLVIRFATAFRPTGTLRLRLDRRSCSRLHACGSPSLDAERRAKVESGGRGRNALRSQRPSIYRGQASHIPHMALGRHWHLAVAAGRPYADQVAARFALSAAAWSQPLKLPS